MADDTNSGGLYGLLGPGLRYVKGRLRILFGTDENSAVPGNLVPGPYPVNTTGATVGEGLVFDGTSYVPGAGGDAVNLASTAPTTITPGDSAAVGSGTTAARSNHKHALPPFGTGSGEFLEGSADAGMLHKSGSETITGHKRLDAQLRITPDTYPPTVGVFGANADGSDPRSLINYSVYGGSSQYRSLGFGSGAQPATLDSIGFQAVDSDTDDYASASFSGSRLAFSFGNFTDPVLSLGEYTVYYEYNTLLWRNHYDTAAGVAVTIAGYSAGDTATDKVGGGLDLKPGEGAGNAAGAVLRLYAGATSTTPGTARNGWVLGLTVGPTAVTAAVPVVASAGLTAQGTVKLALGADAAGDLHYTSGSDGTQARLAAGTGWLHNNGSGTFAYSTPSYSDVGADASGAAASALATAGAYTIGAGAGLTGGGAISGSPTLAVAYAPALKSATTTVSVSAATAPTTGQVLTAVDDHTATWQTPGGGSLAGDVTGAAGSNTLNGAISTSVAWSGLHTFTGTSGPNNAGIRLGVGTESTSGNTSTYWGLVGATGADSSHRGTYTQIRAGNGWDSDGTAAGTAGGSLLAAAGSGGAGTATQAAGPGRHFLGQAGNAGTNNGGGGAAGGDYTTTAGTGSGNQSGGTWSAVAGQGGSSAGTGGTASLDAGPAGAGGTPGTLSLGTTNANSVTIGRSGKTTTVGGALAVNGAATLNGNVTLGDATGDDITITGRVAATIDAKTNNAVDVGSSSRAFRTLYAATSVLTALVDTISAGTLSLGTGNATGVFIGKTGTTTTVNNALTVGEAFTANGNVTLGDATSDAVTILGIPVLPKLTTTARDALTPVEGMVIYNTTTKRINFHDTTTWREVTST